MRESLSWLFCLLVLPTALALAQEPTAQQLRFFETKVRPVLAERCLKCHGPEKQWSSFRLDSREALLKGGELYGAAIVPGKPAESVLIKAVKHEGGELTMPSKEEKLSGREIADLEEWIRSGAAFPADNVAAKSRYRDPKHWAFQKVIDPPLPTVKNTAWVQSPVDQFHPRAIGSRRTDSRSACRQTNTHPPRDVRPDRLAADARRS